MTEKKDPWSISDPSRTKKSEVDYRIKLEEYIENSPMTNVEKFQDFCKYIPTPDLRKFICKYELFKKIIDSHGVVIECGVLNGGGLMAWAQLSEMLEPFNHPRKIIGFDTFSGFPSISEKDKTSKAVHLKEGGLAADSYDDLNNCIELFDQNRILKHIPKVYLVKGDIAETLPAFLEKHPYIVVSLLHLDFDLYEPTVHALRHLLPRIPKGGIIAFDELNNDLFPGETIAVMEEVGISNLRIKRFPFGIATSYAIIE